MTEETELVVIPEESAREVFVHTDTSKLQPYLDEIGAKVEKFSADVGTKAGRAEIKSFAYGLSRMKNSLEAIGKGIADEAKKLPKLIDANRKHARDTIQNWQDTVREPLTKWEEAEKKRTDAHEKAIAKIAGLDVTSDARTGVPYTSEELARSLEELSALEAEYPVEKREEFDDEYELVFTRTRATLEGAFAVQKANEERDAEIARLKKEADEQKAKQEAAEREREERERKEREEREAKEREAEAERKRLEDERAAAEQRAREAEARAENAEAALKEDPTGEAINEPDPDADAAFQDAIAGTPLTGVSDSAVIGAAHDQPDPIGGTNAPYGETRLNVVQGEKAIKGTPEFNAAYRRAVDALCAEFDFEGADFDADDIVSEIADGTFPHLKFVV